MSSPLVSVIVPTYNRSNFLPQCIDAILAQTFRNFELLIVDDGSTDKTNQILQQYRTHKEINIIIIHQENRGVSCARNVGITFAKGDYLTFCDSDDSWQQRKLEWQMKAFAENPECMVCYTDEIWMRNGKRVNPKRRHQKYSGWIFDYCLPLCIVSPSSVIMRKEFFYHIGYFDEALPACEDYDLWLRSSLHYPFHFINKPLIVKRGGHDGQLSCKYWGMDRFRIYALIKCLSNPILTTKQKKSVDEYLRTKCTIMANGAKKRERYKEAQAYEDLIEEYCN